jgi:hypothetical protein
VGELLLLAYLLPFSQRITKTKWGGFSFEAKGITLFSHRSNLDASFGGELCYPTTPKEAGRGPKARAHH